MKNFIKNRGGLLLAEICLALLVLLLLAMDVFAYWVVKWFLGVSHGLGGLQDGILFMDSIYGCSIPAWVAVVNLWKLLRAIGRGEIFSEHTVRYLRNTAVCCFIVCVILLLSALYYLPMLLLALVACFIGAIVCIVASCFRRALQMQDELDFTV